MRKIVTYIKPKAPFDFDLTAGYHTYFSGQYGTGSANSGIYRRLLALPGPDRRVLASVTPTGTVDQPRLEVEIQGEAVSSADVRAVTHQVCWLLGTRQDLSPFYSLAQQDPVMRHIVELFHGLHSPHTGSVFEALSLAIIGQQIATTVARTIRTLLVETHGITRRIGGELFYAFPSPEALAMATPDELRKLKLSQRKAEYLHAIARVCADRLSDMESLTGLSDQQAMERLMQLRGVGHWTAQWALIRALGRSDAFPSGDLALRRIVSRLYFQGGDLSIEQLEEFSQRWRPWRTYATVYLFTALRLGLAA